MVAGWPWYFVKYISEWYHGFVGNVLIKTTEGFLTIAKFRTAILSINGVYRFSLDIFIFTMHAAVDYLH